MHGVDEPLGMGSVLQIPAHIPSRRDVPGRESSVSTTSFLSPASFLPAQAGTDSPGQPRSIGTSQLSSSPHDGSFAISDLFSSEPSATGVGGGGDDHPMRNGNGSVSNLKPACCVAEGSPTHFSPLGPWMQIHSK